LADSASITLLGDARDRYGRLRMGGTLGFALAAPIAGQLVQRYGLTAAFWGYAVTFLIALGVSQKIWSPGVAIAAPGRAAVVRGSRALMTNPRWLLFLAGAFGGGLSLVAANTYLFAYFKELGAAETTMGFALTLSTVFEVPLLFFGHHLLRWLKADRVFLIALVVMGVRMLLNAAAGTVTQALLIQLAAGVAFPMMWLGGVAYSAQSAPAGLSATAQGMFGAAVLGVGCAVGGVAGGLLLGSYGAHALFLVFGLVVLTLVAVVALAGRLLPSAKPEVAISPESAD
jgi:PPP family 3-phenylpropionic acid transporter